MIRNQVRHESPLWVIHAQSNRSRASNRVRSTIKSGREFEFVCSVAMGHKH